MVLLLCCGGQTSYLGGLLQQRCRRVFPGPSTKPQVRVHKLAEVPQLTLIDANIQRLKVLQQQQWQATR